MDDMRTLLPPFRAGWRWLDGSIQYCIKWEREDRAISGLEKARRILGGMMQTTEPFQEFMTETEEDFPDNRFCMRMVVADVFREQPLRSS